MSSSFPFLAIARKHGADYATVLAMAEKAQHGELELVGQMAIEVQRAVIAEADRRQMARTQ